MEELRKQLAAREAAEMRNTPAINERSRMLVDKHNWKSLPERAAQHVELARAKQERMKEVKLVPRPADHSFLC